MAEHQNLNLGTLKNKISLKKGRLNDSELDKVTGGYWETAGFAQGYYIRCPNPYCGRENPDDFETWADLEQGVDQFRCKCGAAFAVDEFGNLYY
ncbi:MAG: hypothetical protein K5770_11475 [Lachnospiraceae bacterium]|nr:hypothetical protein [Lachnospiraceae bacterium]